MQMIDHLFEATSGQTVVTALLLILCLYPISGAFFWFFGALSYRFCAMIPPMMIGRCFQKTSSPTSPS